MTGSLYDSRVAVLAGTLWIGLNYIIAIAFCFSYFKLNKSSITSLVKCCVVLLPIGNIYILAGLPYIIVSWAKYGPGSINWWTQDQIAPPLTV